VIALQSTDATGATSKIVPQLAPGTPVSIPRHAVDAVVTEHGVAWLRGASVRERASAMVSVAAPAWRDVLARAAGLG
jgi:acyl-CoA hydrolase